jgi:hypothetical protein
MSRTTSAQFVSKRGPYFEDSGGGPTEYGGMRDALCILLVGITSNPKVSVRLGAGDRIDVLLEIDAD